MSSTTLLTSAQFLAMPEEYDQNGNRIKDELIAGEVVRMSPPARVHDLIKNNIRDLLGPYLAANPQVDLRCLVELSFQLNFDSVVTPDVSIVSRVRLSIDAKVVSGAPEVAVEIVSPSDTASHLKAKISSYLQSGARSVWIVYPEDRSVVVHFPTEVREFRDDQSVVDPLLPGFTVPVSDFFAT